MKLYKRKIISAHQAGFTLLEMLVYLSILILVIGVITVFAVSAIRAGVKIKTNAEVLDNGRRAVEVMAYEIRKAKSIYTPTSVFDMNSGQISLEQSVSQPAEEADTYIDFFKCGERLCLKREGQDPLNITSDKVRVTNLVFRQLFNSIPSLEISIGVESLNTSTLPDYSSSINITTTVNLQSADNE